jgi:AbrB family looped-hinge helix DNA binding protein
VPEYSARARLREKFQVTLPEKIRRVLRVEEGDELEFAVFEDGTVTVSGWVLVPSTVIRARAGEPQPVMPWEEEKWGAR